MKTCRIYVKPDFNSGYIPINIPYTQKNIFGIKAALHRYVCRADKDGKFELSDTRWTLTDLYTGCAMMHGTKKDIQKWLDSRVENEFMDAYNRAVESWQKGADVYGCIIPAN